MKNSPRNTQIEPERTLKIFPVAEGGDNHPGRPRIEAAPGYWTFAKKDKRLSFQQRSVFFGDSEPDHGQHEDEHRAADEGVFGVGEEG